MSAQHEISEQDLELLESLLDGEAAEDVAAMLRRRIASEPALALAIAELRAQRDARRDSWQQFEPSEIEVNRLVASVRSAVRKDEVWTRRLGALRYVSGAAACLMLGFIFGRYIPGEEYERTNGVMFSTPRGGVQEVMDQRPSHAVSGSGGYKVLLTDSYGNVLGEQRFGTFDEAREFTKDLGRLNRRNQSRNDDVMLIKGEF